MMLSSLSCKEITELVSQSLDRRLTLWEWLDIKLHLMMCRLCTRLSKQLKFIATATKRFMHNPEDCLDNNQAVQLSDEAIARIKAALVSAD